MFELCLQDGALWSPGPVVCRPPGPLESPSVYRRGVAIRGPDVCSGRSQREICLLGWFNSAWVREFTGESLWGEGTIYVPFTVLCLHMSENLIQVPQAKKRFPVPMTEQFRATRGFSCGQPWAPVPG